MQEQATAEVNTFFMKLLLPLMVSHKSAACCSKSGKRRAYGGTLMELCQLASKILVPSISAVMQFFTSSFHKLNCILLLDAASKPDTTSTSAQIASGHVLGFAHITHTHTHHMHMPHTCMHIHISHICHPPPSTHTHRQVV